MLCLLVIAAAPVDAQSPGAPAPTFETSSWTLESMPTLGFDVRLPPGFERVTGDPARAVPSIADIDARDPTTANALIAAAQHIQGDSGLFDGFGLWSVEPATLLQLGILAGLPYRVAAADLQGLVEQSVVERASDLSDPIIQAVDLPAGQAYLAVYIDSNDLSQHREYHIRTPTGRYLILASSYPGIADTTLEAIIEAIARSISPIPDSAGDLPDPALPSDGSADPALERTIQVQIAGIELTRRSLGGESLVSSTASAMGSIAGELGRVVDAPGKVTIALAVPAKGSTPLRIAAYRVQGATQEALEAFVATFPDAVWTDTTIAGRPVRVSVKGADGSRTWLRVAGGPDGTPILYEVDAGTNALGVAAIAALP